MPGISDQTAERRLTVTAEIASKTEILAGGGEMGALMRSFSWAQTPFGPVEGWPQSLRTAASIMLASRFGMVIAWGPDFRFLYNDRYRPILGATKHPGALGKPCREIFPEIWHTIGPLFESAARGEAVAFDDLYLPLDRFGYLENCWFTLSYSPIRDETGGVGGVLAVVTETTLRVQSERRLKTLRNLGGQAAHAKNVDEACRNATTSLAENLIDVPFTLLYLLDADGRQARLAAWSGISPDGNASPRMIDLTSSSPGVGWQMADVVAQRKIKVLTDLPRRFGPLPSGPYPEQTNAAILIPLQRPGQKHPDGVLIFGVSPRRALDEQYRTFFELASDQILTAIRNALAYQEESERAEKLAELDRAKTVFFNNVSHEFRTPLTMMLGPLEDLLAKANGSIAPEHREQLVVAHRNSLRLLKLVNTLLDFSRIEAGRVQANYEPAGLAAFTAELCGMFRPAIERAGLRLVVDCPTLSEPVYVDRDMWEKIVLNLLSNAFKFTFKGEIAVRMRQLPRNVELCVRDTGIGIPEQELGRLFQRFHRVEGARGRTFEGTGIGMALVHELVKLHGGVITVKSVLEQGTEFTILIPLGTAHLPKDRISTKPTLAATTVRAEAFVEEALRWLPDYGANSVSSPHTTASAATADLPETASLRLASLQRQKKSACVLLADDNADMRNYIRRLLGARYEVISVGDGNAALTAARERKPDLILTDVMMPQLDGLGLLKAVRSDPQLQTIPVILLSARAGEESHVEGLEAGADDYLIKPFSARELLARVESHLKLSQLRKEAFELNANLYRAVQNELAAHKRSADALREGEERFRALVDNCANPIWLKNCQGEYLLVNKRYEELFNYREPDLKGKTDFDIFPAEIAAKAQQNDLTVIRTGKPVQVEESAPHADGLHNYISTKFPLFRADGRVYAVGGIATDITERERNQNAARYLASIVGSSDDAIVGKDLHGIINSWNKGAERIFGYTSEEIVGRSILTIIPKDRHPEEARILERIRLGERIDHFETIRRRKDGTLIEVALTTSPIKNADGKVIGASKIARDITDRKRNERQQLGLFEVVATINRDAALPVVFDSAIEAICACQNAQRALILLRDSDGVMRFKAWRGLSDDYRRAVEGHSPWPADDPNPLPVCIDDVTTMPLDEHLRRVITREGIRSLAFIPLTYEKQLLGKFMLYYDGPHHFTAEELRPVQTIAIQVVFAIERKRSGEALEQLVNQRTASLREAVTQMEEFSYSVSHDLRSPLRAMQGYATALAEDYGDKFDGECEDYLQRIIESSSRMERLIHDVLTYSRVTRMDMKLQPVCVDALVRSVIQQYPELNPKRAEIIVQDDLPTVLAHEPSLGQAIANLLNNAAKFVRPGARPKIHITAQRKDALVTLRITDDGIGIRPEHQHRLFGMFERIHPAEKYEGTGIGLALVRRTIERMGGKVGVQSDGIQGSTFWIQLPESVGL